MKKIMLGTPCFAEDKELLLRALRSFQQPDVDVVAVDNGGSPDVKAALGEMSDSISVIRNERNVYVNPAWNQLAQRFLESESEILVLANADLVAAPGWAESLLIRHNQAKEQPEFWLGRIVNQIEEVARAYGPSGMDVGDRWSEVPNNSIDTAGSFFAMTRDGVQKAFPVPSELLIWYGDGWIHNVLWKSGYRSVILRDVVCWHRGGVSTRHVEQNERTAITDREGVCWHSYLETVCHNIGARFKDGTMDEIERQFVIYRDTPADINEHMQKLHDYAKQCESVTEFGVGRSTWAFLQARPKRLRCYDIGGRDFRRQDELAQAAGVDLRFECRDTLDLIIDPVDLLFIDTYHVYRNLKIELEQHGVKARKYIVMHDTEIFGATGEDGSTPGLWAAVEEFVSAHPEWSVLERLSNNNGLTVLRRE